MDRQSKDMQPDQILQAQRAFFAGDHTKSVAWRVEKLRALQEAILRHESEILDALQADLGKVHFEGYACEVGMVQTELRYCLRHIKAWSRPKRVKTPLTSLPGYSKRYSEPYGVVLVMAPWNYPFLLSLAPVIGAVCAGNCFILKPSEDAPRTAACLKTLVEEVFEPCCGAVVLGGAQESRALLQEKFDYIFFTGSTAVGGQVMAAAARHLTPVSLELGGKSPCIVDETADLSLAAKRIAWGKFLNAGQTCVAPDYLCVQEKVREPLLQALKAWVKAFYGEDPLRCEEYPRLISDRHFDRVCRLMEGETVLFGGERDSATRKIAPTLLDQISWDRPVMQEEIFGPILPVLSFQSYDELIPILKEKDKPLALYLFTRSADSERRVLRELSFGGGCINDTILHLASPYLPFGGVGASGMGAYHGRYSFDTFSHQKSVLHKANRLDLKLRYPPYQNHLGLLKRILK